MYVKYRQLFVYLLSILLLTGCSLGRVKHKSVNQESKQQISQKESSHKKNLAKLKAENESLKRRQSESAASSSAKAASESIVAASESAVAVSKSISSAASEVQRVSESTINTSATSVAEESESAAGTAPISAPDIRKLLDENFGCDMSVVSNIPSDTLVKIYKESAGNGEDISGLYTRIKNQFPDIGGNILGPD